MLVFSVVTMLSGESNVIDNGEVSNEVEIESSVDVIEIKSENIEKQSKNKSDLFEERGTELNVEREVNTQVKEINNKAEVLINIKDKNGNKLKDVRCDLMRGSDDDSRMVIAATVRSDLDGKCTLSVSNYDKSYIVKVYWTEDMSRSSQVSIRSLRKVL